MVKFDLTKYKYIISHLAKMLITQHNYNVTWYITNYLHAQHVYISKQLIYNTIHRDNNTNMLSALIMAWFIDNENSKNNVYFGLKNN